MKATNPISKVIWRKPYDHKIYCLYNTGTGDEFLIAPFNKHDAKIILKGAINECDTVSVDNFFSDINLPEVLNIQCTGKADYLKNVNDGIRSIQQNTFAKVVLARRHFTGKRVQLKSLFLCLQKEYEGAFIYCYILENGNCMIGATPETLLEKNGGDLIIEALGGTGQVNGFTDKEYLEHQHIITDISQKLKILSYTFELSDTTVKQAGNVSHLSTIFQLRSKTMSDDLNLLDTLHPTSAVCGLPFKEAYDFICREEAFTRNFYSGYIGFKQNDNLNFYVNLRCAEVFSNGVVLFAGAGISKDSDPEKEWLETCNKLDTMLKCIG